MDCASLRLAVADTPQKSVDPKKRQIVRVKFGASSLPKQKAPEHGAMCAATPVKPVKNVCPEKLMKAQKQTKKLRKTDFDKMSLVELAAVRLRPINDSPDVSMRQIMHGWWKHPRRSAVWGFTGDGMLTDLQCE